jgi:serine/threonine protein kinase
MLACQEYTSAIDMWSVGCIFAELLARTPLFPGEDYIAQLRLICDKLGRPAEEDLDFVTSERARRFMKSLPNKPAASFKEMFSLHKNESEALDLLKQMLEIHPKKRITIEKALSHPFLETLHSPEDEPVNETAFSFEFENEELTKEKVQELIWEEIREYHADLPETFPSSGRKSKQDPDSKAEDPDSKAEAKGGDGEEYGGDKDSDSKVVKKRLITPEESKK